jgi:hypothetical protein
MAKKSAHEKVADVTMRIRVGDAELEVTGPGSFVKKEINEFLERTRGGPPVAPQTEPTPSPGEKKAKAKSLNQLFKMANPRSDIDRTLLATYFLEKYKDSQNSTAAEIRDAIKEARVPPPVNVSDAVNKNIRKGFLMNAGDRENKMVFVLTSDGEAAAEQMLENATP